jgi:hypothetical protein
MDTSYLDALSVFQGTSLGPILFLYFINYLPRATELFSVLYVGDTTGLDSDSDLHALMTRVSMELRKMAIWFQSNRMALNISKTKYIIFYVPPKKVDKNVTLTLDSNIPNTPLNPNLIFKIEQIQDSHANPSLRSFKLLGIHFDEHMSFNANTNALINKLSCSIFFINRENTHSLPRHSNHYTLASFIHIYYTEPTYTLAPLSQTSTKYSYGKRKPLGSSPTQGTLHAQHHFSTA